MSTGQAFTNMTLAAWITYSGQDANSKIAPITINSVSDIQFAYNETNSVITVSLNNPSIDLHLNKYTGNIIL